MSHRRVVLPYKPRAWAIRFHASLTRFGVLVLHRRAGKTTAILNHHIRAATDNTWEAKRLRTLMPSLTSTQVKDLLRGRNYGHIMPTYKQAKLTSWDMVKFFSAPIPGIKTNEAELSVTYPTGAKVTLFGADNPDSLRGAAFSGLSFDEYSQHPPSAFSEVLSKALADHLGYAIFAGTLKGKNQLYRAYEGGRNDPAWFTLWQDIDTSLATEMDAATVMLRQAMEDDRALIAKGLMSQAEFDQEWYLSTTAAIKGAYYTAELTKAREEGRVTRVPYDPALPVDTAWDLGVGDQTVIWFTQSIRGGEVRVIDFYAASGEGLPHYAKVLQDRGYTYGKHWAPHDIRVREMASGRSRLETAASLGIRFEIAPNVSLDDGIHAVRMLLPRCWFDEVKTAPGLDALQHYRRSFNETLQEFTATPIHDWSSHAADAFRYLALKHRPPAPPKPPKEWWEDLPGPGPDEYSWMH